jgi:hypothetical protein
MTPRSIVLLATCSTLLCVPAPAGAAPEPDPVSIGALGDGQVFIDQSSIRSRSGRKAGWRQVQATVQLANPELYAAREITQEVQTQDWDCLGRRYRVILRVFRTAEGQFVRSERDRGAWMTIPKEGPEHRAFETICA